MEKVSADYVAMRSLLLMLTLLALAFFFCWCVPKARGASFYVNPDAASGFDGTSWETGWTNFATIVWGASGVTAGSTLYLSGGESGRTYTNALTTGAAGTSNAPISIMVGQDAGHNGNVTISNAVTIGHDWVTLNGGKSPDADWPAGLSFTTVNLTNFLTTNIGLTVINLSNSCVTATQNEGIKLKWLKTLYAGWNVLGSGAKIHGINFTASGTGVIVNNSEISYCLCVSNTYDGINFASNSGTNWSSLVVKYCAVLDNGDDDLQGADAMHIHHCWFSGRYAGANVGHPDTVQAVGDYFWFHHNYVYGIWNSWIKFEYGYSSVGDSDIGRWRIYNNVFGANEDWLAGGDGGVVINGQLNTASSKIPFTMPAKDGGTVSASAYHVKWTPGQVLMLTAGIHPAQTTNFGVFEIVSKSGEYDLVIKNLETSGGAFAANVEPGTEIGTNWINGLGTSNYLWFYTYMPDLKIPDVYVLNNTFYNGKSSSFLLSGKAGQLYAGLTNSYFKNNIIYNGALNPASGVALFNDSYNTLTYEPADLVVDYNVICGRARILRYQTNWYNDVLLMDAAQGFEHNVTNVPAFVDYSSWNVSLSTNDAVALGKGEDLSALGFDDIDVDITGVQRTGAWSIGAYQGEVQTLVLPPSITEEPEDVSITESNDATFSVTASGTAPLAYQWFVGYELVSGATATSYTITNAQVTGEPAEIQVSVTNLAGAATSRVATLTVTAAEQPETNQVQQTNMLLWLKFDDDLTDGIATDSSGWTNNALQFGRCGETTNWPVSVLVNNGGTTNTGMSATYYFDSYGSYGRSGDYMGVTNLVGGTNGVVSQLSVMCWAKYGTAFDAGGDPGSWTYVHNSSLIDNGQYAMDGGWRLGRINAGDYWAHKNETVWMIYSKVGATNEDTCQLSFGEKGDDYGATDAMRHYAVTFDRGTNSLYLNGVLLTNYVHPSVTNLLLNTRTHWLGIAGWPHHGSTARDPWLTNSTCATNDEYPNAYWFHGQMDDVRLYDRVLTAAEIATIAGSSPPEPGVAPSITVQPQSRTNVAGTDAEFTVTATGTEPLAYQWTLALEAIAGATASSYTATNVQVMGEPASYQVVITNDSGSVTSEVAYLVVTEPGEPEPDTNYYAAVSGLPKMKVGGQQVSMLVKADKFLPLVSANEIWPRIANLQSNELTAKLQILATSDRSTDFTWAQAQTMTYSSDFVWKGIRGVSSIVQGYYSSNAPVWWHSTWVSNQSGWWPSMQYSNGLFQARCVLISPRFVLSQGHNPAPQWGNPQATYCEFVDVNDEIDPQTHTQYSNCTFAANGGHKSWFFPTNAYNYFRFIGTNNQCYFRRSIARYNYWTDCTYPANYKWPQRAVDWDVEGKWAVNLLDADLPPEVEIMHLWPTNVADYTTSDRFSYSVPNVHSCQHNWFDVSSSEFWPTATMPLYLFTCPYPGYLGNSGSPSFSVLNNQAVWGGLQIDKPRYELLCAAMMHLWTNTAAEPLGTCQQPTVVDLSAYARLR